MHVEINQYKKKKSITGYVLQFLPIESLFSTVDQHKVGRSLQEKVFILFKHWDLGKSAPDKLSETLAKWLATNSRLNNIVKDKVFSLFVFCLCVCVQGHFRINSRDQLVSQ